MKKALVILGGLAIVVLGYMLASGYFVRHFSDVIIDVSAVTKSEKVALGTDKILTVYFSRVGNSVFDSKIDAVTSASLAKDKATSELYGNTQLLAQMIRNSVGGDLYMIHTAKIYPASYPETVGECSKENRDEKPLELQGNIPDLSNYEVVFLVYPVWWGTIPKAVKNFAEQLDWHGKRVYAVASHGGSGQAKSGADLAACTKTVLSGPVLEVFDNKTITAAPMVVEWLQNISKSAAP